MTFAITYFSIGAIITVLGLLFAISMVFAYLFDSSGSGANDEEP